MIEDIESRFKRAVGKNYDDVISSDKPIVFIKGNTPAAKKSKTAALMCVYEALHGKNVLCLRRSPNYLEDSVYHECLWAMDMLGVKDKFIILDTKKTKYVSILTCGVGVGKIFFRDWNNGMTELLHNVDSDVIDYIWWEEVAQISLEDFVLKSMLFRNARNLCTSNMMCREDTWLRDIQSNLYVDVFDKSYKDNEFLNEEDREFLDKLKENE